MHASAYARVMIVPVALLLMVAACTGTTDDDAGAEPSPTPVEASGEQDEEPLGLEESDVADVPCEVRELEPPRDDAPETDLERVQEWQETATTFNDVTIDQEGRFYIGSYRHGSVIVLNADRELEDVWTDGVRNFQPQIETHPDGRILLLQDNGLHFFEPDGEHQKYLSMFDGDAGWFPEYGGLGVDSDGHLYVGLDREEFLVKLDEECNVVGRWSDEEYAGPVAVAVDGNDLIYTLERDIGSAAVSVRDDADNVVEEWTIEAPDEDAVSASMTGLPAGGMAKIWVMAEEDPDRDPQARTVADFIVEHYSAEGDQIAEWAATDSGTPEILAQPLGLTVEADGTTHIVDHAVGEHRMRMHSFDSDGQFIDEWRLDSDEALCEFIDDAARIGGC